MTLVDPEDHALSLTDVCKSFGPTRALTGVEFSTQPTSIHALLGGNGSGKSTLIKILAGVYHADRGRVTVDGTVLDSAEITPQVMRRHGLRFVHQDPALFADLSISDNLALGAGYPTRIGRIRSRYLDERSNELLQRFDIPADPHTKVGSLRPATQTMVAIARALGDLDAGTRSVLVLDEPTASLPAHETELLFEAVRKLSEQGQSIIFVTHRIEEVLAIADQVTVLRDGQVAVTRSRTGLDDATLVEYIVGRKLDRVFPATPPPRECTEEALLVAKGLRGGPLQAVDLTVEPGEIVGVAGLLGSGRTELLRMIFGAYPMQGGAMQLAGRPFRPTGPSDAMNSGVAYVPEDRARDAAFMDMTLAENMSIARFSDYWRRLLVDRQTETRDADLAIVDFSIKAADQRALLSQLSGGNQQKVILARWLLRDPALLLLDEPTQGVDVQARADIYALIRERVTNGLAAILVSSDFEELSQVCDRVVVLSNGSVTATLNRDDLSVERLTELVYLGAEA